MKRRHSPPDKAASHIIHICLLIIGGAIISGITFELLLGIPPNLIEIVGIIALLVIGMWLKEHI